MESEISLLGLIGTRISEARNGLRMTLDELSVRTGVSRAMISRIERREVHASAVILDKLCSGLGMTLSSLFERESASPLMRRQDQPSWRDPVSGYVRRDVAPAGTDIRIIEVDFPAGAEVVFEPNAHRFSQHVWVLDGEIEAETEGVSYSLSTGDCLFMRIGGGNSFRNRLDKSARYAVIMTSEAKS